MNYLLQFVMVYDVLICGTGLGKGIQMVHVVHVAPETGQVGGNVKVHKVLPYVGG